MKKKVFVIVLIIFIIGVISFVSYYKYQEKETIKKEEKLISEIRGHYNQFVKTTKETDLYDLVDNEYKKIGSISKDVNLYLDSLDIDKNTKYFLIKDLGFYISYNDVEQMKEFSFSYRYKNYIPFNINIKTSDMTTFYDEDKNILYTINKSYDFPVLIKDNEYYGVFFNDRLVYIKHDNVSEEYENHNTDLKNKSSIRTLLYHFIYDPNTYKCDQIICQSLSQFESHLKYLSENNYFTLKLNELEMYLDGSLKIPEKSAVLTIDDGTIFDPYALDLLDAYKVNATIFVITSWVDPNNLKSNYMDVESHTDNMHNQYECKGYGSQGGGILCLPEEQVLSDLKTSQDKMGGSKYFAYPFFDFNERAITLLKKAGFTMAFIGQYSTDGRAYPNKTDKFKVPRKTIFSSTTLAEFISYLN